MKPCKLAKNVQTIFEISSGRLTVDNNLKKTYQFIVKNLTDFHKMVEAGMDLRLYRANFALVQILVVS